MKTQVAKILRILFPFALGGAILYWMYRNIDFHQIEDVALHHMKWEWMLISFIPGIAAQVLRALRWRQTLHPLGLKTRARVAVCAIYLSYAASLVIPRVGEFLRCGILNRKDGIPFAKSLGTVVTERIVDMIIMALLCAVVIFWQWDKFSEFFALTGVSFSGTLSRFTSTGILVSVICALCIVILLVYLVSKLSVLRKVKAMMHGLLEGILSLRAVKDIPLYIAYSLGIWVCYFLHYYITFYCFGFTENLGLAAGIVSFCTGSIAVIVPTPNGAGPWHFAVKTILVLYGLGATQAVIFAIIVHTVQTGLLVALGIYGWLLLQFTKPRSLPASPSTPATSSSTPVISPSTPTSSPSSPATSPSTAVSSPSPSVSATSTTVTSPSSPTTFSSSLATSPSSSVSCTSTPASTSSPSSIPSPSSSSS